MNSAVGAAVVIYFASGFAALVYQVIWQRLLAIFSGADVQSATLVVGAFMVGLGCGSLAGGYLADRVSPRLSIALFASAEVAIAAFGVGSSALFYDVLYQRLGHLDIGVGPTAAILFVALLWPTFFMGVSLPLLSRGLTSKVESAARTIGWLYGFNTLGAAIGALVATWLFLPQVGLDTSLRIAAVVNLVCGIAAAFLTLATPALAASPEADHSSPDAPSTQGSGEAPPVGERGHALATWALLCAGAGFLGLSLEIVWFRLLGVMVKSTSFTFGTLLGVYLFGLGLGGALGGLASRWVRRPALGFIALQAAVGLYTALIITTFVTALERPTSLEWFVAHFAAYEGIDIRQAVSQWLGMPDTTATAEGAFVRLYILLPLLFVGPPTILAGVSFPLLQQVVQRDLAYLGRRLGLLLAANIAGSTLGAFVTGWFLLDALGTAGTLKLLFVLSASFGFVALARELRAKGLVLKVGTYVSGAAVVVALLAAMPAQHILWARLHGTVPSAIIVEEDRSGVSVLKAERRDFSRVIAFVNGLGQSWIPYGDIHTVLGALPAFVHPDPRSAALIGLGSGDTLHALAARHELEEITSIEIVRPQLATLEELMRRQKYPGLMAILGDSRIEHVFGDGRLHIQRSGRRYDIIEADALRPTSAFAGNLYSEAYFELLHEHLKPGGLAVTWAPTPRIARTFVKVFPFAWQHGQVMMGSNAPIRIDEATIVERLRSPAVSDYFAWAGIDVVPLLRPYLRGGGQWFDPSYDRSGFIDINTDLHPRDEFDIPDLIDFSALHLGYTDER